MGRTQRKRRKKQRLEYLDHSPEVIELKRWLTKQGWNNHSNLRLAKFPATGRGVTSTKTIQENDILITVPVDVMVTYSTIQSTLQGVISLSGNNLKIHDMFSLFLVLEKRNPTSLWSKYINSLPQRSPSMPWLGTAQELNLYPADLQTVCGKNRELLTESMIRLKKSITKHGDCVLDEDLFKWGYVLVNTRAVYIHPGVVRSAKMPLDDVLDSPPNMALCPFLDMFNHHFTADTEIDVEVVDGRWFYNLKTLRGFKKFDEIFICYGPHDNVKLIMEYGFYLPGNTLDTVRFDLQEVLKLLKIQLNEQQYKFIKQHDFNRELFVGYEGPSFNLKALLFVSFNEEVRDFNSVVYSEYPDHFLKTLPEFVEKLLVYKTEVFTQDYVKLVECGFEKTTHAVLMEDFLRYRTTLPETLRKNLMQSTIDLPVI